MIYILSWPRDGSGVPILRFYDDNEALDAAMHAGLEASEDKIVVVRSVPTNAKSDRRAEFP